MSSTRTNKVFLIAGTRGTGKTDFTKIQVILPSPMGRKIIVDSFDNPVWRNMKSWKHPEMEALTIPVLTKDELAHDDQGIFRVFSPHTRGVMKAIEELCFNSLLVFEDATKYIGDRLNDEVNRFVLDSKQKNLDLVFIFHSLSDIPRDLVRIADFLTLFKTNESWDSYLRKKFPGNLVERAFQEVRDSKNRFENRTVQIGG